MTPKIRPINLDKRSETGFVLEGWLKTYEKHMVRNAMGGNKGRTNYAGTGPARVWRRVYQYEQPKVVLYLIHKAKVLVACNPEDDDQLYGFVCFEGNTLHYIYVKRTFERLGVGKLLVAQAPGLVFASHWSMEAAHSKINLVFNPYKLIGVDPNEKIQINYFSPDDKTTEGRDENEVRQ